MWLQTRNRAISIARFPTKSGPRELAQIRGRLRSDVEGLVEGARIIRTPQADYRYRILVTPAELTAVLTLLGREVTYSNFKAEVSRLHGNASNRHDTYTRIHRLIEDTLSEDSLSTTAAPFPDWLKEDIDERRRNAEQLRNPDSGKLPARLRKKPNR